MSITPRFFNSLTRKVEAFTPIAENHVKIYVCGPTVYDRPHLGNVRSIVVYDLLYRLMKELYEKVTYVRNITDVDDKINAAAKEQKISIQQLTTKITNLFYQDIGALNVLSPSHEPRATQHIPEMIAMIEKLLKNGNAYVSENHVLFDVNSYKDYGKLSNRQLDEMISGARIEIASYKRNPLDFVLWKPFDEEDDISSVFESPWGKGRPGWHIECSAMSSKYLGENFDIHGGGADLQFPHHENEIAQSCCAQPNSEYARFWIHNGFLTVNGEKMSKSLKNFVTLNDLLNQNISGAAIRLMLLNTHYRKPFDFNQKAVEDAQKTLEKFYSFIDFSSINSIKIAESPLQKEILLHLSDDLNISKALASLHNFTKEIKRKNSAEMRSEFFHALNFLGLIEYPKNNDKANKNEAEEALIKEKITERIEAKKAKNYAKADEIRKELLEIGIALEDVGSDKTLWKKIIN